LRQAQHPKSHILLGRSNYSAFPATVRKDKSHNASHTLLPVAPEEVSEAKAHGLDIARYSHVVDGSSIQHIFKKHAGEKVEKSRGQIAVTDSDLESIPEILVQPDRVIYGLRSNRGLDIIGYIKRMSDGTVAYLEAVRTKKATLATQTMWKYPRGTAAASVEKALRLTSGTARGSGRTVNENPAPRNFTAKDVP